MKRICVLIFVFIFTGCASTGVVSEGDGVYMVFKQSAAGIFGTSGGVKADVYSEANEFCARTGKSIETVNAEIKDAIPFVRTGSAMLQFRCI